VYYVLICYDRSDSLATRLAHRPAHLARLQELNTQGRLLLAGPMPAVDSDDPGAAGFSGSVIVAQFENLAAAQAWANDDPFVHAGVYEKVDVRPFRKTLP
jgi:uncharacterized protein